MSELVKDARLPTKLDPEHTIHTFQESSHVAGRRARRREREEIWRKKRYLGIGAFGTVSLEECVSDSGSRLRAVREVRRIAQDATPIDFNRELEAIAKLSQQKVANLRSQFRRACSADMTFSTMAASSNRLDGLRAQNRFTSRWNTFRLGTFKDTLRNHSLSERLSTSHCSCWRVLILCIAMDSPTVIFNPRYALTNVDPLLYQG